MRSDGPPIASMITWRRTFKDSHHDFTAELDGRAIGRIYRHTDATRWQFFAWMPDGTGQNGICESRAEAIKEIERRAG